MQKDTRYGSVFQGKKPSTAAAFPCGFVNHLKPTIYYLVSLWGELEMSSEPWPNSQWWICENNKVYGASSKRESWPCSPKGHKGSVIQETAWHFWAYLFFNQKEIILRHMTTERLAHNEVGRYLTSWGQFLRLQPCCIGALHNGVIMFLKAACSCSINWVGGALYKKIHSFTGQGVLKDMGGYRLHSLLNFGCSPILESPIFLYQNH